jgi:hypothetical protein
MSNADWSLADMISCWSLIIDRFTFASSQLSSPYGTGKCHQARGEFMAKWSRAEDTSIVDSGDSGRKTCSAWVCANACLQCLYTECAWNFDSWSSNVKESKIWSIEHQGLNWSLSPSEGRCWSHHRSLCWFLVQGAWQMNTELKNWWGIMHKPLLHLTLLKTRLVIKGRGKRCQPAGQILTQWFTVHASLHKWLDRWCTQRDDVQNLATFSNAKPMLF